MKKNFLIVMPKFLDNIDDEKIFPLGIAYISASMKKAGFNVFNLNLNLCERSLREELEESIVNNRIDVVMTGGLSFQYSILYEMISIVHEIREQLKMKLKIVVGGVSLQAILRQQWKHYNMRTMELWERENSPPVY